MNNQAEEKLIKARIKLQSRNPFFSYLSLFIKFKKAKEYDLPSYAGMGVSPNGTLTYNEDFVNDLNDEECIGVLTHEILHCLTPDMIVGTKDLNISEISVNDMAICDDGKHYNIEKAKGRIYKGELLTIKGQGVLPLKITPNHRVNRIQFLKWKTTGTRKENNRKNVRILSEREYVNAEKLKEGDYLIIPKIQSDKQFKNYVIDLTLFSKGNDWSKKLKPKIKLDNEIAYFIGRFLADGWTNKHPKSNVIEFAFNKKKEKQADKIVSIIKNKFNLTSKKYFLKRNEKEQGVWRVMFQNRMLKEFIREEIGTYSYNKIIPDWILYNPDLEILKNCLKGMYDGDGWIAYKDNQKKESFGYCSVSKGMILKLQKALTRLNCFGNIAERQAIQDLIIFDKLMTKKKDLKTQYIVRCQDKNLFDLFDIKYKKQRATKHYLDLGDSFAVKIRNIKKEKYEGEVYNIKTPRENYTANNILVHNCAFLHLIRRGSRQHQKWNIAVDLAVNSVLKDNGFELPKNGLIPEHDNSYKFPIGIFKKAFVIFDINKKTGEEIYEELPEMNEGKKCNGNCKKGKGEGNGNGKCDCDCGGFDEHLEENENGKSPSQAEKQEQENEWLNRLEEAYVSAKQRGKLPLGMERYIDEIKKSQISWKVLLQKLIQATMPRDYTYCLDKDTKIKTLNGNIKIKDLRKGRAVIGYKNKKLVKSQIKDKFSSKVKEEYIIKTKNNEIKCSSNHRILTTKGYKKAKDLIKSDIIISIKNENKK